jgi:hypothetical protein
MKAFSKKAFHSLKRIANQGRAKDDPTLNPSAPPHPTTVAPLKPNNGSRHPSLPRTSSRQANIAAPISRKCNEAITSASFVPPKRSTSHRARQSFSTHVLHSRIQIQSYMRYFNCLLVKENLPPVSSLQDFSDGHRLLVITSALSGHTFREMKPPTTLANRLTNLTMLYDYLVSLNIPLPVTIPQDVAEENTKAILGVCFLLILHFHFNPLIRTRPKLKKVYFMC